MINRTRYILLSVFVFISLNFAQSVDMLFDQGNESYKNEDWEAAVTNYSKILNQGYESAPLYFNIGNAYFKQGKLGNAILNYERALKLEPGDEDIEFNLKLANARTIDNIKEVPKIFLLEWWDVIVTAFPVSGWALIVVIFYVLLLLFIAIYFMSGNISLQRLSIYGGLANAIILFIILVIFVAAYEREATSDFGVLTTSTVSVKASPTEESNDAFVIHEGLKFEIQDQLDQWVKIRLADGKVGWLPADTFGKI